MTDGAGLSTGRVLADQAELTVEEATAALERRRAVLFALTTRSQADDAEVQSLRPLIGELTALMA